MKTGHLRSKYHAFKMIWRHSTWLALVVLCSCKTGTNADAPTSQKIAGDGQMSRPSPLDDPVFALRTGVKATKLEYRDGSGPQRYWGMVPVESSKTLTSRQVQTLLNLLRKAEAAYVPGSINNRKCEPMPGVAVEFKTASKQTTVCIDLECYMFAIGDDMSGGWGNFDTLRPEFNSWVDQVFPREKVKAKWQGK